jgi:F-type H+-transporting ATPase subunit gamma
LPSPREIRRRIKSIKNTGQITKAMEMVAATKMRRAQAMTLASRPYSEKMWQVLGDLAARVTAIEELHPLLQKHDRRNIGLLLVTGDRGLAGAYNSNVIRQAANFILEQSVPVKLVTVGRKGRDWMVRRGREVIAEFTGMPDRPTVLDISPVVRVITDSYTNGSLDAVYMLYTDFVSTAVQRPTLKQLLPIEAPPEQRGAVDYIYEPDPVAVLEALMPRFVEVEVYQALLESIASEQSARMIAMHNATQNAKEVVEDLTLTYNKARQAGITKEIVEITSGAEALK